MEGTFGTKIIPMFTHLQLPYYKSPKFRSLEENEITEIAKPVARDSSKCHKEVVFQNR